MKAEIVCEVAKQLNNPDKMHLALHYDPLKNRAVAPLLAEGLEGRLQWTLKVKIRRS